MHLCVSIVGGEKKTMEIRDKETKDGQCNMHLGALTAGLALSLVKRTQGKRVINRWEPFLGLYTNLKSIIKYIFGKENKRFKKYQGAMKRIGQEVVRVLILNKTRVGGVLIIIQGSLRSMYTLRYYTMK